MWFKAGISLGVVLAFGAGLWFVRGKLDKLEATQTRLAQVEQMLSQSRNEIAALQLANKLDAQENVQGYEKADWACQQTIKQVVAGVRVERVPVQEFIYVDREVSTPSECPRIKLPDFFRMSDIQRAGTDPD
ncbi:MAG: hypothetical protein ACK5X3_19510 [Pseudomonadota bacterium]|jgi:hypothetical protein